MQQDKLPVNLIFYIHMKQILELSQEPVSPFPICP